jgi:hypothetical protein
MAEESECLYTKYMSRLRLRMAPTMVFWCCIMWDMEICVTCDIPKFGNWTRPRHRLCPTAHHGCDFLAKRSTGESVLDSSVIILIDLPRVSPCYIRRFGALTYNIDNS